MKQLNFGLDRSTLEEFMREFAADADVRDFLLFEAIAHAAGLSVSGAGPLAGVRSLHQRPERLWEFVWLFKGLELRGGGLNVLFVGGPLTHITFLAALAGNHVSVTCADARERSASEEIVQTLSLDNFAFIDHPQQGFDRIIWCSGVRALSASDQAAAVRDLASVLKQGGRVGFTFHYGQGVKGGNLEVGWPHEPPATPAEARSRFVPSELQILGNQDLAAPVIDGSNDMFTIACLFAGKPPLTLPEVPCPATRPSLLDSLCSPHLFDAITRTAARRQAELEAQESEKQTWAVALAEPYKRIAVLEHISQERLALINALAGDPAKRGEAASRLSETLGGRDEMIDALEDKMRASRGPSDR